MTVAYPGIFFGRGGSTNSVEDRGQREWESGGGNPHSRVPLNLQMNETHILIMLLRMYMPRNWEFGSALANFGILEGRGGLNPTPPLPLSWSTTGVLYTKKLQDDISSYVASQDMGPAWQVYWFGTC
jgi:hypothetical protein